MTELTTTEPGSLDRSGLRRALWILSTTVITSYGVLYYAFAVLAPSITRDTGWTPVQLTAAFSASQVVAGLVGLLVGPRLDRFGPRAIMTTGSVISTLGVLALAAAPTLPAFFAAWLLTGLGMSGVLYPPAFAALTRWGGARRVQALTTLTLVAGLASTIYGPLTAGLDHAVGWRWTYLVLAAAVAAAVPLHWFGLAHPWEPAHPHGHHHLPTRTARTRPFILLMISAGVAAFVVYAGIVNIVPLLVERGLTTTEAAIGLGIGGAGQVAGRLFYARIARYSSYVTRTVLILAAVGLTTGLLAVAPAELWVLFAISALIGVARGLYTLIQATAVSDRWGPTEYGRLSSILSAPVLLMSAIAPFAGAGLAAGLGGQSEAFAAMAILGLGAAIVAAGTSVAPRSAHG